MSLLIFLSQSVYPAVGLKNLISAALIFLFSDWFRGFQNIFLLILAEIFPIVFPCWASAGLNLLAHSIHDIFSSDHGSTKITFLFSLVE